MNAKRAADKVNWPEGTREGPLGGKVNCPEGAREGALWQLMKIGRYFGEEKQVCKLIEELGEAVSAASRVLMLLTFREDGGKDLNIQDRLEHLAAELADVQNVSEQVISLFGLEVDFKVARQTGIDKTLRYIERQEEGEE